MKKKQEREFNVFDIINSLSFDKKDYPDDILNKHYNTFIVNKQFSYFPDTILHANELNQYQLPIRMQYEYYLNSIKSRRRFSKWVKTTTDDTIEIIKQYFNVNTARALEFLSLLTNEQIIKIKEELDKGGMKK
jgi:hypothetical protein